jgi:hypothetical protein
MTNHHHQDYNQTLLVSISTLSAGVLVGGLSFIMSRQPLPSLGLGTAGSTLGAAISTIINKKRQEQLSDQFHDLQTSLINLQSDIKNISSENTAKIGHINDSISAITNQINQSQNEILSNQQQVVIKVSNLQSVIHTLNKELSEVKTKITPNNQPANSINPAGVSSGTSRSKKEIIVYEALSESDNDQEVIDYIINQGFIFNGHSQRQDFNVMTEENKQIALYLGQNYAILEKLYHQIKHNINTKFQLNDERTRPYKIYLPDHEEVIPIWKEFCEMLNDFSFFSKRPLFDKTDLDGRSYITVDLLFNQDHYYFLKGLWFEPFVEHTILKLLNENNFKFTKSSNIDINFAATDNQDLRGELDLLFLVEDQPLWIECKTRIPEDKYFLWKYSKIAKKLSIPKERAFLVVWELADNQAESFTSRWDITVVNRNNFLVKIKQALGLNVETEITYTANTEPLFTVSAMEILTKKYAPSPEYRPQVLQELINLFSQLETPLTLAEVKRELVNKMQIEEKKIYQILKTLWNGGSVQNAEDKVIKSFNKPASKLITNDPAVLEAKCLEQYVKVVLFNEQDFFENSENQQQFISVVGGDLVTMENIDKIKKKLQE